MKKIDSKHKLIIIISLLSILVLAYLGLTIYNTNLLKKYNDMVFPGIYVGDVDLSSNSFDGAKVTLEANGYNILSKPIKLIANGKEYNYKLNELGVTIDCEKSIEQIKKYQEGLTYSKKIRSIYKKEKQVFNAVYKINDDMLRQVLGVIVGNSHVDVVNGYFDVSNGVSYNGGSPGYDLNVEESIKVIKDKFSNEVNPEVIELVGDTVNPTGNENYAKIDTLTSAAVTPFMPNTYARNINLNTALAYINGTVVEPGEVFSYCDKAGPFNKKGYVFYYEFVGNGVCQIATTTYNAALLGGLEIVKRYPHKKKSLYIDGGLDATVASYNSGWCVDMQFKNTYQYPIYIKAYSENGNAHVEFWSNSNAKDGFEYTTESVKIGVRGYRTYLHKWKDGVEVDKSVIATTWYSED
ncbi:MAG: VanW family protein [Bacilli bacterium]|nr:VanW family protein [Bacilli bacterium]